MDGNSFYWFVPKSKKQAIKGVKKYRSLKIRKCWKIFDNNISDAIMCIKSYKETPKWICINRQNGIRIRYTNQMIETINQACFSRVKELND